jgi:oligoendopeptidase F
MNRYTIDCWDLTELLPSEEGGVLEGRLAELEDRVASFEASRRELSADLGPDRLCAFLTDYEQLVARMHQLSAYASLRFAADTQSGPVLTLRNRLQHVLTGLSNRILFFTHWWRRLDDDEAAALLPDADTHPDLRHFLEDLRRLVPYTLEEQTEQVINTKDANGIEAVLTLYAMLTSRLEFNLELEGERHTLTRDGLTRFVRSSDPEVREAAYRELLRVYRQEAPVLAQIYVNRVRDWHEENIGLRGFSEPIAVRNLANDLPGDAVTTLLEVTRRNAPLFQRYFRMKAGWLGRERLRRFDLYAPVAGAKREVEYTSSVQKVLEVFGDFDPRLATLAERVFSQRHIDSEVRRNKQGGAFCMTILPDQTPWLLLNWTGEVRDVATLAHELGHAVHSMLAEHHSVLTQHPVLPLAETASVFGEMLVTDHLLAEEKDPLVRRELLAGALDDIYATVMRQAWFTLFEIDAHRAVMEDRSPAELEELYLENLRAQFGESLDLSDEFRYEWLSIPHIYNTPFYCYAYSFGQLLVLSLYKRFRTEGERFKPGYLRLLAHGGAARPRRILEEVDIEVSDPAFWQGGFDVIAGMLDELESF